MDKIWYSYKDFITGKMRRTQGRFVGWTAKMGFINARYAKFSRPCSDLLIPEYLLTPETKAAIKNIESYRV